MDYWKIQDAYLERMKQDYEGGVIGNPVYKPYFLWKFYGASLKTFTKQQCYQTNSQPRESIISTLSHFFILSYLVIPGLIAIFATQFIEWLMGFFDFLDSNNHVLAKIDGGKLLDRNNHVIGKITWSGDVQDSNNHTLGHISRSGEVRNRWYSKLGSVSSNGDVLDSNNHKLGSIDFWGTVKDRNGHTIGYANGVDRMYAAVFFFFDF